MVGLGTRQTIIAPLWRLKMQSEQPAAAGSGQESFILFNAGHKLPLLKHSFTAHFKGSKNKTMGDFYKAATNELNFPDYFSSNLDSFNDLLLDLSWIAEKHKRIVLVEYNEFLSAEPRQRRLQLLSILQSWAMEKDHEVWIEDEDAARKEILESGARFKTF